MEGAQTWREVDQEGSQGSYTAPVEVLAGIGLRCSHYSLDIQDNLLGGEEGQPWEEWVLDGVGWQFCRDLSMDLLACVGVSRVSVLKMMLGGSLKEQHKEAWVVACTLQTVLEPREAGLDPALVQHSLGIPIAFSEILQC